MHKNENTIDRIWEGKFGRAEGKGYLTEREREEILWLWKQEKIVFLYPSKLQR